MYICSFFFFSSGSFANTLPTYQRSEVMLFIMGKIPVPGVHLTLPSTGSGYITLNFPSMHFVSIIFRGHKQMHSSLWHSSL